MFTLNTIKRECNSASYSRGREYYNNGSVTRYSEQAGGTGIYKLSAVVQGERKYKTSMTVDCNRDSILQWHCSCPYDFGGMCKHLAALGMKFFYESDASHEVTYRSTNTGHMQTDSLRRNTFSLVDTAFRADHAKDLGGRLTEELARAEDKPAGKYNEESITVLLDFENESTGLSATRDVWEGHRKRPVLRLVSAQDFSRVPSVPYSPVAVPVDAQLREKLPYRYALLFEYVCSVAPAASGVYTLPWTAVDILFSMLQGLDRVFYRPTGKKLSISDAVHKPSVKVSTQSNGELLLEYGDNLEIIPGKLANYGLADHVIMKLNPGVPGVFYSGMKEKRVSVRRDMADRFVRTALPVLRKEAVIDESQVKPVVQVDIKPEILLSVKYGKCEDELLLVPEINYGGYQTVRPFLAAEAEAYRRLRYRAPGPDSACLRDTGERIVSYSRAMYLEHDVYSHLEQYTFLTPDADGNLTVSGNEGRYRLIRELLPRIPSHWVLLYDKGLENLKVERQDISIAFDFSLDEGNGLLDFDLEFQCGRLNLTPEMLYDFIRSNRSYMNVGGNLIEVSNREELERLFTALVHMNLESGKSGGYRSRLSRAPELEALVEKSRHFSARYNESYNRFIQEMKNGKPVEAVSIPEAFRKVLRPYQVHGVEWMHFLKKYGFGGILADDMGLGKTLQALVMLSMSGRKGPSLVVCPKTLMYNWQYEIRKFVPEMKVLLADGPALERERKLKKLKEYDVVVTSYPLLHKDIKYFSAVEFEYCVIDEAQYIKNPATKTAQSVKAVKARHRLALSGTPMENSLLELWSVFDFVMPDYLGSEGSFRLRYQNAVPDPDRNSELGLLNRKIKPFILRRTKKQMLKELPPRIDQVSYAELTPGQLALYTRILEQVRSDVYGTVGRKGFEKSHIEILAALTRLRQICNHPGLLDEKFMLEKSISGKMEMFEELIDESVEGGHKVLVFSQFTKMLNIFREHLEKKKWKYCYLDGRSRSRQSIIDEFNNNDEVKIFLISIKAGGFGLNLTSADTVIIYDPWWNPMVEEQAADRAHRIGQENTVNVYRLITKGTVEEKIQRLQERKRALFDSVINDSGEFMQKLTWEDLKEVLG